ncbi:MAG: GNAT family N-acetyltransferase [Anaerolineae bacterium]|nr:MAG: GNAT family N-acetyltransferase [Anaerolineae bacterium]
MAEQKIFLRGKGNVVQEEGRTAPVDVRDAAPSDRGRIATLIHFEQYVHRHLGWRSPVEWLGKQPFLVAEQGDTLQAALACPPDPPEVAWLHLFAARGWDEIEQYWDTLWERAYHVLQESGVQVGAALPQYPWVVRLLQRGGFEAHSRVIMLSWDQPVAPVAAGIRDGRIRPMTLDDLDDVAAVDAAAFDLLWRHSRGTLHRAYQQASVATVAEKDGKIVGYQISTATGHWGGHLARLAVLPEMQGQGVGGALVRDVLQRFTHKRIGHITVNTQHDNAASLRLYKKLGFRLTGEHLTIYTCPVA